jgi:DNA-binding response OmpR family regulator
MVKILLVDDESNSFDICQRELEAEGYEVATAVTGLAALELFKSQHPDLVILEARLSGMDGLELTGHLLSIDRHVPVIIRSAYTSYRENYLSWLAAAYLDKASDLAELKHTIRELLENRAGYRILHAVAK